MLKAILLTTPKQMSQVYKFTTYRLLSHPQQSASIPPLDAVCHILQV
jgi:hypothetical protein